ncbi:hypothetical protein M885DRAFT_535999 [Pelagophyceae sp. CCMP2097]|nr:hypothetical protein M885DRAFT_535999 [Pelagophyceae sp. CCMP2097]
MAPSWLAVLVVGCACGAPVIPHVRDGFYDTSWFPQEVHAAHTVADALRLAPHKAWLVAFVDDANEACVKAYEPIALRQAQRARAARYMQIAVATKSTWKGTWPFECGIALLEDADQLFSEAASVPLLSNTAASTRRRVYEIAAQSTRVDPFTFINMLGFTIDVKWYDITHEEGIHLDQRVYHDVAQIAAGASTKIASSLGHVFAIARADTGDFVAYVTCDGHGTATIDQTLLASATCSADPIDPHAEDMYASKLLAMTPHERVEFAAREHVFNMGMEKRLALSDVQSTITPNVTVDGFLLIPTPKAVHETILAFYLGNHQRIKEIESDGGPLYNQRAVPTWHTPLPPALKQFVFDELKVVMEAWAPSTAPLRGTSAYGVRTYESGSYLHLHVDTASTHVVSGILNIAQDVRTPWPLEILDHSGKHHAVVMQPGDLLLYESAKLLHGRPQPLDGDSYANVFVHYAPETGWHVDL